MNQSELSALSTTISNPARVLYLLYLRVNAHSQSGQTRPIQYRDCFRLLNDTHQEFNRGRQINRLLHELMDVGLIATDHDLQSSLNGHAVHLPLMATRQDEFEQWHQQWGKMQPKWQPDEQLFNELATMVGLTHRDYHPDQLGEFVAYWLGRPEVTLTPFQWAHKFVMQLKKRHTSGQVAETTKRPTLTNQTPALAADDNAKKLVEKYRGHTTRQD